MNVRPARLDNVNTSQPQPVHSPSQQSLFASDHSTFSDYASGASSVEQRNPSAAQYETPPSRAHSPITIKPAESEMTLPTRPVVAHPAPLNVRRSQGPQTQIPVPTLYRDIHDSSPPTPGMDESPYIRFAIEQLTRDEELLGRGRQGSLLSLDYPVERLISDEGLGYYSATAPAPPKQVSVPPRRSRVPPPRTQKTILPDVFVPINPPQDPQYPRLGYLPLILRPASLLLFIFICLLIIAGLIVCNLYSTRSNGLYDYDGTGTSIYFVFQFMPQLLGLFIIFWIFVLQAAVYRIIPFASMSSQRLQDRVLQDMSIHPANFLLPDLRHFKWGEPVVGICLAVFWISYFTVPLLSCMFQTQLFGVNGVQQWRWTSVQAVVWVLIALYALLIAASILLMLRFRQSRSALMWDPVSLADLIVLFQNSNLIPDLNRSEISESIRTLIPPKTLRLGYWTTSRSADIFHTIGEANAPARRHSNEQSSSDEKSPPTFDSPNFNIEYQRYSNAESFTRNIHSPFIRYRWTPWFLRDSFIVAWIVAALTLYLAFLLVSFINHPVERGFSPLSLLTVSNAAAFSPSNFLFSFLPSLLGMALFLAWQPIDTYFRAIQPFANLSHASGATARHSLLLSYPSHLPVQTTLLALLHHDHKLAFTSAIALLSSTLPVLAGGVFTAQFFDNTQVRIAASMPAYYALCVFLGVYAFAIVAVWPKRKRYLPHGLGSLADHLSFLYASGLLGEGVFNVRSKEELVRRLGEEGRGRRKEVEEVEKEGRFAFGIYVGRDGREHLGIDRLQRVGNGAAQGEMAV